MFPAALTWSDTRAIIGNVLKAQIHGKLLRDLWINNEDLLTSAVFGTLSNLDDDLACAILADALPITGGQRLTLTPPLTWQFWPWWAENSDLANGCEPDVVVSDARSLVVIEAKLFASFGAEEGKRDQLDREWRHGQRKLERLGVAELWLVPVTADPSLPWGDILAQLDGTGAELDHVAWLNWTSISRRLRRLADDARFTRSRGWISDIRHLIASIGLAEFNGYGDLITAASELWTAPESVVASWAWSDASGAFAAPRSVRQRPGAAEVWIGFDELVAAAMAALPTKPAEGAQTWF